MAQFEGINLIKERFLNLINDDDTNSKIKTCELFLSNEIYTYQTLTSTNFESAYLPFQLVDNHLGIPSNYVKPLFIHLQTQFLSGLETEKYVLCIPLLILNPTYFPAYNKRKDYLLQTKSYLEELNQTCLLLHLKPSLKLNHLFYHRTFCIEALLKTNSLSPSTLLLEKELIDTSLKTQNQLYYPYTYLNFLTLTIKEVYPLEQYQEYLSKRILTLTNNMYLYLRCTSYFYHLFFLLNQLQTQFKTLRLLEVEKILLDSFQRYELDSINSALKLLVNDKLQTKRQQEDNKVWLNTFLEQVRQFVPKPPRLSCKVKLLVYLTKLTQTIEKQQQ